MDSSSMLQQMTLQQKASLLAGASHWDTVRVDEVGLESITLSDGPHGLRHQPERSVNLLSLCLSPRLLF